MALLSDPVSLGSSPPMRNRLVLAPLTNQQSNHDGTLGEDEYQWLIRRAEGGFGMATTCAAYVSPGGQAYPGQLGAAADRFLPGLSRLADGIRNAGALSCLQLLHAGVRAPAVLTGERPRGPWSDESKGVEALETHEIRAIADDFVAAAVRADRAGFDAIELHAAHGYLICQFLDGRKNRRGDGYGGSLGYRARLLMEVVRGIRESTRPDFIVGVRLTPERHGIVLDEARTVASWVLLDGLVDYLDLSLRDVFKQPHEPAHDGLLLIDHFMDLPRGNAKVGVGGKIRSAADAQWCLDRGADFVLIGQAGIVQHDFARRALADPRFVSIGTPVSRRHLQCEFVGPAFIDYLAANWDDFVL